MYNYYATNTDWIVVPDTTIYIAINDDGSVSTYKTIDTRVLIMDPIEDRLLLDKNSKYYRLDHKMYEKNRRDCLKIINSERVYRPRFSKIRGGYPEHNRRATIRRDGVHIVIALYDRDHAFIYEVTYDYRNKFVVMYDRAFDDFRSAEDHRMFKWVVDRYLMVAYINIKQVSGIYLDDLTPEPLNIVHAFADIDILFFFAAKNKELLAESRVYFAEVNGIISA